MEGNTKVVELFSTKSEANCAIKPVLIYFKYPFGFQPQISKSYFGNVLDTMKMHVISAF
jgi:hypothetical protein